MVSVSQSCRIMPRTGANSGSSGALPPGAPAALSKASPFIKWAGGKRQIVDQILSRLPSAVGRYYEPFLGGGAVFLALAAKGHLQGGACLADINPALIETWQVVKTRPGALIDLLALHARRHDSAYYYLIRNQQPDCSLKRAARFIYLNKTCYNGLYRVNRKGEFNVPPGRYRSPQICNADNIKQVSHRLQDAEILCRSFADHQPRAGDFIYCDPPYDGCFAGYTAEGFARPSQQALKTAVDRWCDSGANVMLSNADTAFIRGLYGRYHCHRLSVNRQINCQADRRGQAPELLITSWPG